MVSSICFQRSDSDLQEFFIAVLAVEVFMLAFFMECKVYDLSTALFFAVALGLLARGKFKEYYLLFPLACLNRETPFLLIIFFAVYYFSKLENRVWAAGIVYQGFVFIMIRIFLMSAFANNAGTQFLFQPLENFSEHMKYPLASVLFFGGVMIIIWMCMRKWQEKPIFLRTAVILFTPALMVLYGFFGVAFEIRVFAEVYPVVWALVIGDWRLKIEKE